MSGSEGRVPSYEDLQAEVERLRAEHRRFLRQSNQARQIARYLWRLEGVREQWTPPEKYELDWLTRELAAENGQTSPVSPPPEDDLTDEMQAALDAHYAENPHARPTAEQVAQALREQTGDQTPPANGTTPVRR